MTIFPPMVVGPISECNASVIVNNLRTGSTVSIFSGGTRIGGGIASFPVELFQLTAPLTAGQLVHARQELAGETSAPVPFENRTRVQPAPADMSSSFVQVGSIVYECGNCLQISSAVPGARVQILSGAVERGAAVAVNGSAHIDLSPATQHGDTLQVRQVACGVEGPSKEVDAESGFPGSSTMKFPRPRLKELHACDRGITATNLVPGARVIAVRSGGPTAFGCTTAGTLTMSTRELQEGETVTAHQEFPECGIESDTTELTVGPATPVPVPSVFPSICAGTTRVLIQNLRAGAMVHIFVDGVLLGDAEASSAEQVFQIAANSLAAGNLLTAAQTVCGNLSEESEAVVVASAPAAVNTPSISGPLHACAPAVMVQGLTLGAQIMIRDQTGVPRSDSEFVSDSVVVLTVSPALMPGETLVASIRSCGVHADSAPVTVEPVMVPFRPPRIQSPVLELEDRIEILDAIPGATVEISLDNVWTYSFVALRAAMDIFVGDLPLGTAIRTRQRLCSAVSVVSKPVVVRAAGPRIVTEFPLPDGEVGVPYNAAIVAVGGVAPLEWSTSGMFPPWLALSSTTGELAGTPEKADNNVFTVKVQDSGSPRVGVERSFGIVIIDGSTTPVSGASRVDI